MHSIELDVKSFTENGTAHANLIINNKDCGVLYLSEVERDLLVSAIQHTSDDIAFMETLPETDSEIDIDIFDD